MLLKRIRPCPPSLAPPPPLHLHAFLSPPSHLPLRPSIPIHHIASPRRPVTIHRPAIRLSTVNQAAPPTNTDDKILAAISRLSNQPRLTIADIAAAAALPLPTTQQAVHTLALLVGAPVDLTDAGDLAYRFPKDTRARLRRASLSASLRMTWQKIFPTLFTVVRVLFGALLIVSIVVTFVAIAALSSATRSDDDRRESRGGGFMPVRFFAPDIFDVMFYTGRARRYRAMEEYGGREQMSFLEAVYSFVFGDGDPNAGFEDRRWKLVAATIRANRGAVTAEQVAPYLDLAGGVGGGGGGGGSVVDEGFMLPVLQRFGGYPEVTEEGDIVYVFPSLRLTGARQAVVEFAGARGAGGLVEKEVELTGASAGQRAMVVALGVVNVVGVLTLGVKLMGVTAVSRDAAAVVGMIRGVYPALVGYATSFVVVPVARWLRLKKVNREIRERNRERSRAAVALGRPNAELRRKLRSAEGYKEKMEVVREEDVVYSSDLDALDQPSMRDQMTEDFDRRLNG